MSVGGGIETVLRTRLRALYSEMVTEYWLKNWRAADQVERRRMERMLTTLERLGDVPGDEYDVDALTERASRFLSTARTESFRRVMETGDERQRRAMVELLEAMERLWQGSDAVVEPTWKGLRRRAVEMFGEHDGDEWVYRWLDESPTGRIELERKLSALEDGPFS